MGLMCCVVVVMWCAVLSLSVGCAVLVAGLLLVRAFVLAYGVMWSGVGFVGVVMNQQRK